MLAGLIFAVEEATDRPGTLVASLPFGGMTLLEYQIRLLFGAGAERVLIAVGRMTPQLLAAVNRATKQYQAVDIVRSAEEAAEKFEPNSRVLVIADGLVTTDPVMDRMGAEGAEALLVTDDSESHAAIERLDMRDSWAGIARISAEQLAQIAKMPDDYDFQSALLRIASQSNAEHIALTAGWLRSGHSVERSAEGLAARNTGVLAALTERRVDWADRWIFTPIARRALPEMVGRNIGAWVPIVLAALFGGIAIAAIWYEYEGLGLVSSILSAAALATSSAMAALRGEERKAHILEWAILGLFGAVLLANGWMEQEKLYTWTPMVFAGFGLAAQFLVERVPARHRRWWASPSAHLLLLTPFALAGMTQYGVAFVAAYAFATLAAAIESVRGKA